MKVGARKPFNIPLTPYSIDVIFNHVTWQVEYTDEFELWWNDLSLEEQEEINAKVLLLEERGPVLPRPHSDVISGSRHANMKELRGSVAGAQLRVLYAFDPRRTAILLIGGNKTGDANWYRRFVPIADDIFDWHLEQLKKDKKARKRKG